SRTGMARQRRPPPGGRDARLSDPEWTYLPGPAPRRAGAPRPATRPGAGRHRPGDAVRRRRCPGARGLLWPRTPRADVRLFVLASLVRSDHVPASPMGKILHRYIFREVVMPFLLGLGIFTFVLLIARLLKLIELVVNRGLPATQILELLGYLLPAFLEATVPMAMLLAILIAFGRLSPDAATVGMRSSGLSICQLALPVALFVVLTMALTASLSMYARPWGNRNLEHQLWDIARTRASAGLKPQVFNDEFPGMVIYAEHIDTKDDRLIHVMISDERDPDQRNTVFANEGLMISDNQAQTVTLRLLNGTVYTSSDDAKGDYHTDFETYDVNLDLRETMAGIRG